ncbi:MAG: adenylate/guanylate cyclase domain-containing protein [Actinomycetota bacterium]|nr:adenylate/guanylate cyclase domain-containing protein [Actinomycetota bacterium]
MAPHDTEPSGGLDGPPSDATPPSRAKRLRRFAARVDAQPSLLNAADRLRRELPGDERFGDVLSTAGGDPVEVVARGVSALQPERGSLVQELGLAGLQVWQSLSEATGRGHGPMEMAILFTDLVGFSSWALKAGDAATLELLRDVGVSVEGAVTAHDGRVVKRLGDGVMATFLAPRAAVDAALEAQAAVAGLDREGRIPRMRAGVHWGSPRRLGGDYLGVDVNIAARVSAAAKPTQVLVSDTLLARMELGELRAGRAKRLRADGTPRDLHVVQITRG